MDSTSVGNVKISRIHEMVDTSLTPAAFFPKYDEIRFLSHIDKLIPIHYDEGRQALNLSIHSWLVRTRHHVLLIDSCVGNQKDRMPRKHWHNLDTPFLSRLREAGVEPEEIDFVMCTHMHADHIGWNTMLSDGRWVPTFPNARYIFGRVEYEYWLHNSAAKSHHRKALVDSVLPVVAAGQAEMIEDGYRLDEEIVVQLLPGHTPGNFGITVISGGEEGVFVGDTVHHPVQIYEPDWSTSACTDPVAAAHSRRKILEYCVEHTSLLLPAHFCSPHAGYVSYSGENFSFSGLS